MERCYLSNPDVLLRIQKFQYTEGRAKGTEAFRVTNAAGLDFTVLIDRAMGIGDLFYKGERISFLTENGVVNPAYYEPEGTNWLRSFGGGFLCTCGLDQVGEPCEGHGIHGRIDNIPAQQVCSRITEEDGVLWGEVSGVMRQTCHQGVSYELRRTLRFRHDAAKITLADTVVNMGEGDQPYMLLYHVNFGCPFLTPETRLEGEILSSLPLDPNTAANPDDFHVMPPMDGELHDYLYLHDVKADDAGRAEVSVAGEKTRVTVSWPKGELNALAQWRRCVRGCYVMATEPTNTHVMGQDYERENGTLQKLAPGEKREISLEFGFDTR